MFSIRQIFILTLFLIPLTQAISSKSADSRGIPSDVQYIKCETCSQLSKAASEKVQQLDVKSSTELQTLDIIESMCDPSSINGRWMRTIDLVERLGKLRLIAQDGEQLCKQECRTLALACSNVLDGYETELAEKLYAMKKAGAVDIASIESWLCAKKKGISGACDVKPPLLPKDREKGPAFSKMDEKKAEMEKLMQQMKAMNGGKDFNMNMFSKDQSGGMGVGDDGDGDEDEDDEDDEVEDEGQNENEDLDPEAAEKEDDHSLDDTSLGDTASESLGGMDSLDIGADRSKTSDADTGSDEL